MYDFNTHPVHLSGLILMIRQDEYDDSPATFIPLDASSDRLLHEED